MKYYKIINDSGVDYAFIQDSRSWVGQVVRGFENPRLYPDAVTVEKPFGLIGTYTTSSTNLEEVAGHIYFEE